MWRWRRRSFHCQRKHGRGLRRSRRRTFHTIAIHFPDRSRFPSASTASAPATASPAPLRTPRRLAWCRRSRCFIGIRLAFVIASSFGLGLSLSSRRGLFRRFRLMRTGRPLRNGSSRFEVCRLQRRLCYRRRFFFGFLFCRCMRSRIHLRMFGLYNTALSPSNAPTAQRTRSGSLNREFSSGSHSRTI